MRIVELKDLERLDTPIYYRRVYTARAILEWTQRQTSKQVRFAIETTPYGTKEASAEFLEDLEYPLVPALRELKRYVGDLERGGRLP
ncbi:MAG TPA: hypothetical protein PKW82_09030 [Spirochaetales bacterium]|nr:hypothetical protein [Spirochaetales bacterium]